MHNWAVNRILFCAKSSFSSRELWPRSRHSRAWAYDKACRRGFLGWMFWDSPGSLSEISSCHQFDYVLMFGPATSITVYHRVCCMERCGSSLPRPSSRLYTLPHGQRVRWKDLKRMISHDVAPGVLSPPCHWRLEPFDRQMDRWVPHWQYGTGA